MIPEPEVCEHADTVGLTANERQCRACGEILPANSAELSDLDRQVRDQPDVQR